MAPGPVETDTGGAREGAEQPAADRRRRRRGGGAVRSQWGGRAGPGEPRADPDPDDHPELRYPGRPPDPIQALDYGGGLRLATVATRKLLPVARGHLLR